MILWEGRIDLFDLHSKLLLFGWFTQYKFIFLLVIVITIIIIIIIIITIMIIT